MDLSQHLAELLTLEDGEHIFLTAYLDTSVGPVGVRTYPVFLRKRISIQERLVQHRGGETAVREFRSNVSRMEEYLTYKLAQDTRGCAVFCSLGRDFFKAIEVPVVLKNTFSVATTPNLDQLIELRQKSRHYAVVTLDQHSGRIFSIFMHEAQVPVQEQSPEIPPRSRGGGWSQMRYQRNRQDKIEHFRRYFGDRLKQFLESESVAGVLVLATPENAADFIKQLPPEAARQILLTAPIPSPDQEDEILRKSLELIDKIEQQREGELVTKLYERLCQDFRAVVGVEETLFQLQIGRVERLFIGPSFQAMGRRCQKCGFCFSGNQKTCTYCLGEVEELELRSEMEKLAARREVSLELVEEITFLDSLGGTGALLRF